MRIVVSDMVYLPKRLATALDAKSTFTVKYYQMGAEESKSVHAYHVLPDGSVAVPRKQGLQLIAGSEIDDQRAEGFRVKYPRNLTHTGEWAYQDEFVKRIVSAAKTHGDFKVSAPTGRGKTVCSLSAIQKLGRTALIVVDQDNLMTQWVDAAKDKLGLQEDMVGVVQGKRCEYEGKAVVVAMVQSLVQKKYPEEFYRYFGVVCFDEAHTCGAPTFSKALGMFTARVRFGVSATLERRDALATLLDWHLGDHTVSLDNAHEKSYVYYLESTGVYSWYANVSPKTGRILEEVSSDAERNALLVEAINWLYESGRDTLVISDRIEQLEELMSLSYYRGIPAEEMGLYCGYRNVWAYEKDPTPPCRPLGYVRGTEYTPVKLTRLRKRIRKKDLESVKNSAKVLFATYGMFSKGVDVPRLSGGIDCTARSKAQQVHGRILRAVDGKLVPIWVTVRDVNSYRLEYQFLQRLDEYVSSSAEIYEWRINKGVRYKDVRALKKQVRQRVGELKDLRIEQCLNGTFMLQTPDLQKGQRGSHAPRTGTK